MYFIKSMKLVTKDSIHLECFHWLVVELLRTLTTDRQTDRQTYIHTQISHDHNYYIDYITQALYDVWTGHSGTVTDCMQLLLLYKLPIKLMQTKTKCLNVVQQSSHAMQQHT